MGAQDVRDATGGDRKSLGAGHPGSSSSRITQSVLQGAALELDLTDAARRRYSDASLQYRQITLVKSKAETPIPAPKVEEVRRARA